MFLLVNGFEMKNFYEIIKSHADIAPQKSALKYGDQTMSYAAFFNVCKNVAANVFEHLNLSKSKDTIFIPIVFERSHWVPITIQSLLF